MNCPNCGATLEKDARFCVVCGNPVPEETPAQVGGSYTPGADASTTYTPGGSGSYTPGGSSGYTPGGSGTYTPGGASGYTPGGSSSYTPGGSNGYTPGGSGNFGGPGYGSNVDPDNIREYFFGRTSRLPAILIVGGAIFFWTGIGLLVALVGVVLYFVFKFNGFPYEDEVDTAWKEQKAVMHKRGLEKLNLVQEQMSLIKPLVLVGFGKSPDSSFATAQEQVAKQKQKQSGFFAALGGLFSRNKKNGTEYDPVFARKVGSDGRTRSLLQEVTVYAFTENQVMMYSGDVDISTGLVYNKYTAECFYEDIEGIQLSESLYKIFNTKKRRYENRLTNQFVLYLGGCNFPCSVNSEVDSTVGEGQFAAMRSLIREKKNG